MAGYEEGMTECLRYGLMSFNLSPSKLAAWRVASCGIGTDRWAIVLLAEAATRRHFGVSLEEYEHPTFSKKEVERVREGISTARYRAGMAIVYNAKGYELSIERHPFLVVELGSLPVEDTALELDEPIYISGNQVVARDVSLRARLSAQVVGTGIRFVRDLRFRRITEGGERIELRSVDLDPEIRMALRRTGQASPSEALDEGGLADEQDEPVPIRPLRPQPEPLEVRRALARPTSDATRCKRRGGPQSMYRLTVVFEGRSGRVIDIGADPRGDSGDAVEWECVQETFTTSGRVQPFADAKFAVQWPLRF